MKRSIFLVFIALLCVGLFATTKTPVSGKLSEISGATTASATLDFTLDLTSDSTTVDSYRIGFSTGVVDSLDDTPTAASAVGLTVDHTDFKAKYNGELYVYWQLFGKNKVNISLSTSALKESGESPTTIDVTVSTSGEYGTTNDTSTPTSLIAGTGNAITLTTNSGTDATGKVVYSTSGQTGETIYEAAGSVKVAISTTEAVSGLKPAEYTGQLTLKIAAA